ncbi:PRC-barrel domain-containing protein [Roseovarius nitratireducens]|uniref:PRC-barrel domain-containing protein n=1 Tax=Roseovarius nitratireducens TaxID=2044597 RepID=UPI000CE18D4F|nr:PRC-barrel domain-containing protein [Roseovarius nitratireducens]
MQKLLSTTAMVVALGFPAMTLAQSSDTTASSETQGQSGKMSGFLSERGQSDLYASDLMGHDVHARRSAGERTKASDQASGNADQSHRMATMKRGDLDNMDKIGQINEIVLSSDGQVRALVIGVGGFLGMGEQDVAVTMEQVTFASDADDRSQMYIVVSTGADMLQDAPAYDRTKARNAAARVDGQDRTDQTASTAAAQGNDGTRNDARDAFAAPQIEREGYDQIEAQDVSTDMLTGKTVYDVNDNDVGDVTDMILDKDGKITNVVIDFGGFLGIGSSQASLQFEELTIVTNKGYEDVRLYVDATKEQIQDLPRYMASK